MERILIGLVGQKGSGKDTVCEMIKKILAHKYVQRIAFADALKEEVADACGITPDAVEARKSLFRPMLQWWGTEFRRGQDIEYWIKRAREKIEQSPADVVVVTDVRFQNEADTVRSLGGILVKIDRGDSGDSHDSERWAAAFESPLTIDNSGTLEDLYAQCLDLVENFKPAEAAA